MSTPCRFGKGEFLLNKSKSYCFERVGFEYSQKERTFSLSALCRKTPSFRAEI
ncbi:hypothetical protein NEILACOT_03691 [Neisseria lactamica ATCC 23970]|uniref:Uncharacterized protein n=1 Tax=Neisseria lactamica ATCC 23970 TaxID=546265 RepID=D0W838_NEILA|nr:hypothetical protein NEILACOT_03691 [Neisseria lactamica ATCC 23970]